MPKPTPKPDELPAELERRLEALEHGGDAGELNARSWFWLLLLGVGAPAALLLWGWWA